MIGCFFPTQVLFLDDNVNHLNSVASEINEYKVIPKLFNNSIMALNYLTQEYKAHLNKEYFLVRLEDQEYAHGLIDIDIRSIHKIILNPQRFQDISVLVSDYSMPDMHGMDFLNNIKSLKIKKIMLTGEAEATLAVKAFNNNLIQRFIRKDAENFSNEFNSALDELQEEYFNNLTGLVIESIIADPNNAHSCLSHPIYSSLFNTVCQELEAVEYYLLDEQGSFLFADIDGNLTILAVKSQECMQEYYTFAKEAEVDNAIIEALEKRVKLPFFYSEQDLQTPPEQWGDYLYSAKKVEHSKPFYYALIKDVKKHIPELTKITSFKDYLENM